MDALLKKLNFKNSERILVLGAPAGFAPFAKNFAADTTVETKPVKTRKYDFLLLFVKSRKDVRSQAAALPARCADDAVVWFAYPKKTSKKYECDISRDDGWQELGALGFEGVRMIAIDADWSALRFRRTEQIKSLNRDASRALSPKGKSRARNS